MKTSNVRVQSERIRDIAIAARRGLADALRPVLEAQIRQAMLDVESGAGRNLERHAAVWERQLMEVKHDWALKFAVDGYRLGEVVMGKSAGLMELFGKDDWGDAAVLTATEESISGAMISRRVGQDVARYVAETSKLETSASINRLSEIFNRDVAENKTVAEIARDFADEGASWVEGRGRADLMARTMSQWAYNHGSMAAYADAGLKSEWLASTDACPAICLPLNGVIADAGGMFDGQTYPGHPNCVIGETPVFIPRGQALAGLVTAYCGPIIELTFADGRSMSVTANHMLLTPYGFARAQHLRKGDAILDCAAFERIILRNPDYDGYPARADEIVESLAKARSMATASVPLAAENLNGDGVFCEGEVGIIRPDGLLSGYEIPGKTKLSSKQAFGARRPALITLSTERNFTSVLQTMARSANSIMGGRSESSAFSRREIGVTQPHGFAWSPANNTTSHKASSNAGARDVIAQRDGLFRLPVGVRTAYISRLRIRERSVHVYTLQTKTSLYTINGLVSSNCQCTVIPVLED